MTPGRERVAEEDVGVAAERHHAFLDPGAAGIVQTHNRRAHLHREIHDFDDLCGVRLRQRPAENREVLRERIDRTTFDPPLAGDDAVAGNDLLLHPEVAAAVRDELVDLLEGARIEQQIDALRAPSACRPRAAGAGAPRRRPAPRAARALRDGVCSSCLLEQPTSTVHSLSLLPVLQELLQPDVGQRVLEHASITAAGHVQMSAPIRAASTIWMLWRTEATRISVVNW